MNTIKEVYTNGYSYNQSSDANPIIPAILDIVSNTSQMPAPPENFVEWNAGLNAARFRMDLQYPTQTSSTLTGRVEHHSNYPPIREAEDIWLSISYFIPSGEGTDPLDEIIYQWHIGGVGGSPPIQIQRVNGRFRAYIWIASGFVNQMAFDLGSATQNIWHNFIVKVKFHPEDGELTVWKNGLLARCHNPVTGQMWQVPTANPGGGVTNDYVITNDLGFIEQTVQEGDQTVSLLVWKGKTTRGTYPNPTKYPKWGFYKSQWSNRYDSNGDLLPGWDDPESPLYVAPENRVKIIFIRNVKFETRLGEFSHLEIYRGLDINNEAPIEYPDWWNHGVSERISRFQLSSLAFPNTLRNSITRLKNDNSIHLAINFNSLRALFLKLEQFDFDMLTVLSMNKTSELPSILGTDLDFSRNGPAPYYDKNGDLQTAGVNVPRMDFDPATGYYVGVLLDPANIDHDADLIYKNGLINVSSSFMLYELRNGNGVVYYYDAETGVREIYMNGAFVSSAPYSPSPNYQVTGMSDHVLALGYKSGQASEAFKKSLSLIRVQNIKRSELSGFTPYNSTSLS